MRYLSVFDTHGNTRTARGARVWVSPEELRVSHPVQRDQVWPRLGSVVRFDRPTLNAIALEVWTADQSSFVIAVHRADHDRIARALWLTGWTGPIALPEAIVPCRAARWPGRGWLAISGGGLVTELDPARTRALGRSNVDRLELVARRRGARLVANTTAGERLEVCRVFDTAAASSLLAYYRWPVARPEPG